MRLSVAGEAHHPIGVCNSDDTSGIRFSKKWKDIVSITNRQALLIRPDDFVVGKVTPEELLEQLSSVLHIENHPN